MRALLKNHVLAWLAFFIVIILGVYSYQSLPRQQDPTINFNWINITTPSPGLGSSDVESKVTDVIEDALQSLDDVDFVQSTSTNELSSILVRFNDIDDDTFRRRISDLRREVDSAKSSLPESVVDPIIFEVTSSNAFPSAMLILESPANNENLRFTAELIADEIERMPEVDSTDIEGINDPELQIRFDPIKLSQYGINPTLISDTIRSFYQDIAAGSIDVQSRTWNVRIIGTSPKPEDIAEIPLLTPKGKITIGEVADVSFTQADPSTLISSNGTPATLITINKKANGNLLELVERVKAYVEDKNVGLASSNLHLRLLDDQTAITRNAIDLMQNNAIVGLFFVLIVSWLFLGRQIALLTSIGIIFTLSGSFIILGMMGQTLNQSILLGVVIALGMIVDDAVVVVESLYYRMQRGMGPIDAAIDALREVAVPVTTAILTTIAIFLPLMLVPGILGKFLLVIPLVVTIALLVSLVEAFWMLPSHVGSLSKPTHKKTKTNRIRQNVLRWIRNRYSKALIKTLRKPFLTLFISALLVIGSVTTMGLGATGVGPVKFNFFASDTIRLFYLNVEMPTGTPIDRTLEKVQEVETIAREELPTDEVRGIVSMAGIEFSQTAPNLGDQYGQVVVSLPQRAPGGLTVEEMIDRITPRFSEIAGTKELSTLKLTGGPPAGKAINVKVLSNDDQSLQTVVGKIKGIIEEADGIINVTDDSEEGVNEVVLTMKEDEVRRLGFQPTSLNREVRLMSDGEQVSTLRHQGENVAVKVMSKASLYTNPTQWMSTIPLHNNQGERAYLSDLFNVKTQSGKGTINHYNFVRNVTIQADIDERITDTVAANQYIMDAWDNIANQYPNVSLDFSGQLDDIQESLNAIGGLFLFGLLLIYLILGTQFNSFFQPFLILSTVPLAFSGVVLGIIISGNAVSLYTMYGVVALMGIAVNAAIVLIAAANDRIKLGLGPHHAIVLAARRRVIPILITASTTIAGLFSLAAGLAGHSLVWAPVANAIVWGLGFSTALTLFVIPALYLIFHRNI